jgi:hypothetical protein
MLIALAGCTALGLSENTFNKQWSTAQQTDTAVLSIALTLAQAGKLSDDMLKKVEAATDNAEAGLTLARTLYSTTGSTNGVTNASAAETRVSQILAGLLALQTALESPNAATALVPLL